jgi:heme oxygenase
MTSGIVIRKRPIEEREFITKQDFAKYLEAISIMREALEKFDRNTAERHEATEALEKCRKILE